MSGIEVSDNFLKPIIGPPPLRESNTALKNINYSMVLSRSYGRSETRQT